MLSRPFCQVGTHGSGLTYAFFMPNGTGLVEILAWNFYGKGCTWADQYFRQGLKMSRIFSALIMPWAQWCLWLRSFEAPEARAWHLARLRSAAVNSAAGATLFQIG